MEKTEMMKQFEEKTGKQAMYWTAFGPEISQEYLDVIEAKATDYDLAVQENVAHEFTILQALKGRTDYEGLPVSEINWLQVLRREVEKAKDYDRMMSMNSISENDIQIVLDGNAWCAYRLPFRNLQEDNAGFGVTPQIALTALLESELPDGWETKGEGR